MASNKENGGIKARIVMSAAVSEEMKK